MEKRGVVRGVHYTTGSGLAVLILTDATGAVDEVPADAGPLFRVFAALFGNNPVGHEVRYNTDRFGVLKTLEPANG